MNDQDTINNLREALAGAVGCMDALADMIRKAGYPSTADHALQIATGHTQTLKDTAP